MLNSAVLNITMEKLKKCRICLVEKVRMYVIANKNLQEIYEKLTDVPFVTEDSRPTLACFFCCTKLKQCYQLQRKCLEAEELFTKILDDNCETKPLINQSLLEFCSGFTITSTVNISIVDECQTESIAIKEELPSVCEGLDDIVEPKEEHQSDELEMENFDDSCLDVPDIVTRHSESDLEQDVPLTEFKIEVEEQQELPAVCEGLNDIIEAKEEHQIDVLEPENFDNSCLDVPHHSESDLEDDLPLMEIKIEVEEDQEVSTEKRRARERKRVTVVAKKPKLDTRRTKLEDAITAEETKREKSVPKVIRTKRTSKPAAYFKEPYKYDQRCFRPKGDLTKHIRKHAGEKPYKCDICQRSFSVKCSLLRHIRLFDYTLVINPINVTYVNVALLTRVF